MKYYISTLIILLMASTAAAQRDRALKVEQQDIAVVGGRVALVIGNADYPNLPLRNSVNDAADVAEALEKCGFDVSLHTNVSREQMLTAIDEFGLKIAGADAALFYFAGHGMQVEGINWLVPIGASPTAENEVRFECVEADRVMAKMDNAGANTNIIILDACRNNPFPRQFRNSSLGLANMAAKGTIVSFAAAPGTVAEDGDDRNGMFTKHLLARMMEPGVEIEQVLKNTRQDVSSATQERQWPQANSLLVGNFYFVPPTEAEARPADPDPPSTATSPVRLAALQGDSDSQNTLGRMLSTGDGIHRDAVEALDWFRKAAEQGHADAQNNLGTMYFRGLGVAQNNAEALRWFRRAAAQNHVRAQYNLGVMHDLGRGTSIDALEAYAWYSLAARAGDEEAARAVSLLESELSPSEFDAAKRRANALSNGNLN